jgi:hypothetical protein
MSGVIPPLQNMKWRAQALMRLYCTLFCFGRGETLFVSCLKIDLLFKLLFEKYFPDFPHLRVSLTDVIKFGAILLILMIILSCTYAGEV